MKDEERLLVRLPSENGHLLVKRVRTEGRATSPTLVFLHDALGSIAQWRDFPEKLSSRCRLDAIVYDRFGHGGSSPFSADRTEAYLHREALEILPELLQQLRINYPLLIGHSDGGTIALIYAAYHQAAAAITEAAHAFVEEMTLDGIREAVLQKAQLIPKLSRYHAEKTEPLFDAWADTWLNEGFQNWTMAGLLPRINCPALIIQGRDDEYGSEEQVNQIVSGIGSNAEAFWIEQCGHIPHRQEEEVVLKRIASFIEMIKGER